MMLSPTHQLKSLTLTMEPQGSIYNSCKSLKPILLQLGRIVTDSQLEKFKRVGASRINHNLASPLNFFTWCGAPLRVPKKVLECLDLELLKRFSECWPLPRRASQYSKPRGLWIKSFSCTSFSPSFFVQTPIILRLPETTNYVCKSTIITIYTKN